MDEIDRAQHEEELSRQQAEMFRQATRQPALPMINVCHWCSSAAPGRIFCSLECAIDWQASMRKARIEGRKC